MKVSTCRRCGRAISDPDSVRRGYGSLCWRKMRKEERDRDQELHQDQVTITDPQLAAETRLRIRSLLLGCERQECFCGDHVPIHRMDVITYDHAGGYNLPGYGRPQWVILRCPKCGYEWSFWKLRGPDLVILERPTSGIPDQDLVTPPVGEGVRS